MFQCDINDAPVIGILGIVSQPGEKLRQKDMYSVFDLNRSQASILLTLHHCESNVAEGSGKAVEYYRSVDYIIDP